MDFCIAHLTVGKLRTEVVRQRINPDALDGLCVAMEGVKLAASLRVTEVPPVGGLVTGAHEAGSLHESFQQNRTIRVASVPVLGQSAADQAEHARSEIFTLYPWQDQKSRVVDDEMQVGSALLGGPTDHLIARLCFPSAGAEAEDGDNLSGGAHEITQLRSRQRLMPEIMMTFDVGVPQQGVALFDHDFDRESIQIHRWHHTGLEHGLLDLRMRSISHRLSLSRRRQCDQAVTLHPQQRHAATHVFEFAVASTPVQ